MSKKDSDTPFLIFFTRAEFAPVLKRLHRIAALGAHHRPSAITPERWQKFLAGKCCQPTFDELNAIAKAVGWYVVLDEAGQARKAKGRRKAGK